MAALPQGNRPSGTARPWSSSRAERGGVFASLSPIPLTVDHGVNRILEVSADGLGGDASPEEEIDHVGPALAQSPVEGRGLHPAPGVHRPAQVHHETDRVPVVHLGHVADQGAVIVRQGRPGAGLSTVPRLRDPHWRTRLRSDRIRTWGTAPRHAAGGAPRPPRGRAAGRNPGASGRRSRAPCSSRSRWKHWGPPRPPAARRLRRPSCFALRAQCSDVSPSAGWMALGSAPWSRNHRMPSVQFMSMTCLMQ